jgi:hypothetical protein
VGFHHQDRTVGEWLAGLGRRCSVVPVDDPNLLIVRSVEGEELFVVSLIALRETDPILRGGRSWGRGR